ncbi:MAG: recD2 [Clostridia bacterium]|nr:recD2 [Clostridia bacterium]
MPIKNNYEKNVFNWDIVIITGINLEERSLTIRFDENEITYDISEMEEVVLSYATTIHKAQGSEYNIVVMPITMQHYMMLQRNLLYTGVTRAKKIVVIVGSKKDIYCAINNNKVTERNTRLAEKLNGIK